MAHVSLKAAAAPVGAFGCFAVVRAWFVTQEEEEERHIPTFFLGEQ
jgi:hypothetical protein